MKIKKFNLQEDYERIINFLREMYKENKNMSCWLPERFDDLIFRVDTLYRDERGKLASQDFIYIWEEDDKIVGIIIPDGDCFNTSIRTGYENIFPQMLDIGEKELRQLFDKKDNGKIDFLVVSHDSLKYQAEELKKRGYIRDEDADYDNVQNVQEQDYKIELPHGFHQVFGDNFTDAQKGKACHYGFHPQDDDGKKNSSSEYEEGSLSYQSRKKSQFFKDSFESLIVTDDGDICSYCFVYVDKVTSTAFVEPVSTRGKYRMKGFCKQMLHGAIIRLKEMGIEKAFINSYAWRRKVYNSSGFVTEDSIGFWTKEI